MENMLKYTKVAVNFAVQIYIPIYEGVPIHSEPNYVFTDPILDHSCSHYSCWQNAHWHPRCRRRAALLSLPILSPWLTAVSLRTELALRCGTWVCSLPAIQHKQGIRLRTWGNNWDLCEGIVMYAHSLSSSFWALSIYLPCFNINPVGISVVGCFYWWTLRKEIAFSLLPWTRRE